MMGQVLSDVNSTQEREADDTDFFTDNADNMWTLRFLISTMRSSPSHCTAVKLRLYIRQQTTVLAEGLFLLTGVFLLL